MRRNSPQRHRDTKYGSPRLYQIQATKPLAAKRHKKSEGGWRSKDAYRRAAWMSARLWAPCKLLSPSNSLHCNRGGNPGPNPCTGVQPEGNPSPKHSDFSGLRPTLDCSPVKMIWPFGCRSAARRLFVAMDWLD